MSAFDDAVNRAAGIWYSDDLADELTYNGTPVNGHIERNGGDAGGNVRRQTGLAHVQKTDVPDPAYRDVIVDAAGTIWTVIPPVPENASAADWTLNIEANVAPGFGV